MRWFLAPLCLFLLGVTAGAQDTIRTYPQQEGTSSGVLKEVSATITAAEVQAFIGNSGRTLVDGVPGHAFVPVYFQLQKSAGAAFATINGAEIAVGWIGSAASLTLTTAGLMDQVDLITKYRGPAAIGGAGDDSPGTQAGFPLGIMSFTGTFTGGSTISVRVFYYDVVVP